MRVKVERARLSTIAPDEAPWGDGSALILPDPRFISRLLWYNNERPYGLNLNLLSRVCWSKSLAVHFIITQYTGLTDAQAMGILAALF